MSQQGLFTARGAAPDPRTLPIEAFWPDADMRPSKDLQKVRQRVHEATGVPFDEVNVGTVCELTAADAKDFITPPRLFKHINGMLSRMGLGWKVVEKWPGRKVVTDLWATAYRDEMGKSYTWDLTQVAHNAAFTSKDHEGAMAVVATVGHMVMVGGCQDEEDMLPWADWFKTPPDRLDIGVEQSSCALREGQLVRLDGARWRPSRCDGDDNPEAVVVGLTDGGYTLDRSQRAIVEAAVSMAMSAYIHETSQNRGDPRLRSFAGNLGRYLSGVLSANAEAERQKVIAFRFLPGGHQPTRAEREQQAVEAAQEPEEQEQPDALDWRRYVGVRG